MSIDNTYTMHAELSARAAETASDRARELLAEAAGWQDKNKPGATVIPNIVRKLTADYTREASLAAGKAAELQHLAQQARALADRVNAKK